MDVISRVEPIAKRIGPDVGAKYIELVDLWPRQDAAYFIFERPDGSQARVHVDGFDCIQHYEDRMLEGFVRAKVKAEVDSSTH